MVFSTVVTVAVAQSFGCTVFYCDSALGVAVLSLSQYSNAIFAVFQQWPRDGCLFRF